MQDIGQWTSMRARIWGITLLVGMLLPIVVSVFGQTQLVWPWDVIGQSPLLLLPLLLGIVATAISYVMTGKAQGIALFFCGLGVLVLSLFLSLFSNGSMSSISLPAAPPILAVLFFCSLVAIAVGNHLRKGHPMEAMPRFLTAGGGIVLVACFVIPFSGQPPIVALFDPMLWKASWGMELITLAVLAYGVVGGLSLIPMNNVAGLCLTSSILSRGAMAAFPLLFSVTFLTVSEDGSGFMMVFMMIVKMCAMLYGLIVLPAVGLASWLGHGLAEKGAPAR